MDHDEVSSELDQMASRLHEGGLAPTASAEECQRHLWHLLLQCEGDLRTATLELHSLRTQQDTEMKEVENYVEHIRGLLQERESLMADHERDNQQLRTELWKIQLQQDSQRKEVAEMLAQEGLGEISLSSPSEQVAYLLVERATLLERLEAAERQLDTQSLTGNLREVQLQEELDHVRHTMEEGLRQQRKYENMIQVNNQQESRDRSEHQRLERDLEEASQRLDMAHKDIRRLTDELESAKKTQGLCDMIEMQKVTEHNERLEGEIQVLRDRVRSLDSEKKSLLQMRDGDSSEQPKGLSTPSTTSSKKEEQDQIHKKCHEALDNVSCQLRELQRRMQKHQREQEDLVERNEELEALLGEAQNASKEHSQCHEGELEGLNRKIQKLKAELKQIKDMELAQTDGAVVGRETETYLHQLKGSSQERMALLEARWTKESDWRKQLEADLRTAHAALKKDKESLQRDEKELRKLRLELQGLQTECQQGKTLIKSLTQVKAEKRILEEKVAQLERAQSRLQGDREHQTESSPTPDDLRQSKKQVAELESQVKRLTSELSRLEKNNSTLRDEIKEKRQATDFQDQLTKKWAANGEKDEGLNQVASLKYEISRQHAKLVEEHQLASQHQLALQAQVNEAQALIRSQESVLGQKSEENKQLKQDLQRAQSLFTSAERELRYEREKNLDLKRHNALLEQEKIKVCAELKQALAKLSQAEQNGSGKAEETERLQHRIRELELELARSGQTHNTNASLQGELQLERARVIAADKKVLDLQQQLKSAQHQVHLEEARAGETSRLERDCKDMSDVISALRAKQQEGQLQRKLLEAREEELQHQVRCLKSQEVSLGRQNSELGHRTQQMETRLAVLEAEHSKLSEEHRDSLRICVQLEEELASSKQESDRLQEELQQVIIQLDTRIRKYNEKQSQHMTKLSKAKQIFLKATAQRDRIIQKLENDLTMASSLSHKEKDWMRTVMEENENLLVEKRELLKQMSETEEMGSDSLRTAFTVQHRVNFLEMENRQLQERTLKLASQVGMLERTLRNAQSQSLCKLEDIKKMFPSESLASDSVFQTPTLSLTSGVCDPLGILNAICRVKVAKHVDDTQTASSTAQSQSFELSYLNLTSPVAHSDIKDPEEEARDLCGE
ncbi:hypothetical protein DPEC_G00007440 [Dallia pectoralis]|uniref:Uncharacterized protein n=1 Tax=Dallia pectoralis TaxID=75939 RepID=A0ACC2HL96_DALPE|nr:hypothetical protein DPEC_G00007440 [Dallia pectoralis]